MVRPLFVPLRRVRWYDHFTHRCIASGVRRRSRWLGRKRFLDLLRGTYPFTIHGPEQHVALHAGPIPGCAAEGSTLVVTLDESTRAEIEREIPLEREVVRCGSIRGRSRSG